MSDGQSKEVILVQYFYCRIDIGVSKLNFEIPTLLGM